MIVDEVVGFNALGLEPNKLVMATNILHHMEQWEHIDDYYTPGSRCPDGRARYLGLFVVEAIPAYSDDPTITPGECFVCCAASSGKVKGINYD